MKLSTKGRYAMVAMADIALSSKEKLVTLSEISKRQNISMPYLEQLFVKLRRAKLVISVRGPGGGQAPAQRSQQPWCDHLPPSRRGPQAPLSPR